jgi:hypothetical protein
MNQQMLKAQAGLAERKTLFAQKILQQGVSADIYGSHAMLHLLHQSETRAANEATLRVARWFELPHPTGRDHQGEVDFAAIRLIRILYQSSALLTEEVKAATRKFFLTQNFRSMHGSENHSLMFFAARYLAAQYYADATFAQYDQGAEALLAHDGDYLREFIRFRARYGWGEFDSCGYSAEIMLILLALRDFAADESLRTLAQMMLDVILMDMAVDSLDGLYGGAHGRIYEPAAMDNANSGMFAYYCLYFGSPYMGKLKATPHAEACASSYVPSDIVYQIALGRKLPYENREAKHLHCCSAWAPRDINWETLGRTRGRISKYTYLTPEYLIGAVNMQDDYPPESKDAWYAHHQQHEWDLTLVGDTNCKIFSHHPGVNDYYKTHGYWTGDLRCGCGTFFCHRNIALAMYDIQKESEAGYIHLRAPLAAFDEVQQEKELLLLRRGAVYVALRFSNGYEIVAEGEYAGQEVKSYGRKCAIACEVGLARDYGDLERFARDMRAKELAFDRESMTLRYGGMCMSKERRWLDGRPLDTPYDTYDSPYLRSKWDSGVIQVNGEDMAVIYDFNKGRVYQAACDDSARH